MAEAEFFNDWLRQRLAEAEVKKPHFTPNKPVKVQCKYVTAHDCWPFEIPLSRKYRSVFKFTHLVDA